jgi:hypothetical protein
MYLKPFKTTATQRVIECKPYLHALHLILQQSVAPWSEVTQVRPTMGCHSHENIRKVSTSYIKMIKYITIEYENSAQPFIEDTMKDTKAYDCKFIAGMFYDYLQHPSKA